MNNRNKNVTKKRKFISDNIDNSNLIFDNYGRKASAIYLIKFGYINLYLGESAEVYNRLYTHMCNPYNNPFLFGLTVIDITSNKNRISIEILEYVEDCKFTRKLKETAYITKYKPVLQNKINDRCINKKLRRPRLISLGIIQKYFISIKKAKNKVIILSFYFIFYKCLI